MAEELLKEMEPEHAILSVVLEALNVNSEILGINDVGTNAHNKIWVTVENGRTYCVRISKELQL